MDVIVTGSYGRCGTALIDHLHDRPDYDFTYFNRSDRPDDHPYGGYDTVVGTVIDYDSLVTAVEGHDALVHLAACSDASANWAEVFEPNYVGTYNALEAAREAEVESVVFASSNHAVGMYEVENAPEIYEVDFPLVVDHESEVRPDGHYGVSKAFGEDLARYYVENFEYPKRVYVHRIAYVLSEKYDHPYGPAELGVDGGRFERGDEMYAERVEYGKAIWFSRRDYAGMTDAMLQDDTVDFGIFNGVSDNDRRWFDLEHVRSVLGFIPEDNGEKWDEPPG